MTTTRPSSSSVVGSRPTTGVTPRVVYSGGSPKGDEEPLHQLARTHRRLASEDEGEILEPPGILPVLQVELGPEPELLRHVGTRRRPPDHHQLVGLGEGERIQEDGLDDAG